MEQWPIDVGDQVDCISCLRRKHFDPLPVQKYGANIGRIYQVSEIVVGVTQLLDLYFQLWLTVESSSLIDCSSSLPVSNSSVEERNSSFMA